VVRAEPAASLGRRIGALALTVLLVVCTLVVGWLVWSVVEWCHGRTPSYRLLGLRVVRRVDRRPIRLGRSFLRSLWCLVLVVPTVVIGSLILLCFAFGASPPDGLFAQARRAPWDVLTATTVLDERPSAPPAPSAGGGHPLDAVDPARTPVARTNGHVPSSNGHTPV
jgi:hypothetical protein